MKCPVQNWQWFSLVNWYKFWSGLPFFIKVPSLRNRSYNLTLSITFAQGKVSGHVLGVPLLTKFFIIFFYIDLNFLFGSQMVVLVDNKSRFSCIHFMLLQIKIVLQEVQFTDKRRFKKIVSQFIVKVSLTLFKKAQC